MKNIIEKIIFIVSIVIGIIVAISSKAFAANVVYTDKEIYKPGETITVTYSVDNTSIFGQAPWIGLVPADVSHGSEYVNDCNDIAYYHVSGKSQVLTFTAPSKLGTYDFRLNDTDYSGKEIAASDVFKVSNEDTVSVSSVFLDKSNLSLKVGEKENITALILPQNAANKNVLWSSSDSSVVSVNSEGQVTGLKEGVADITCTTINGRKTSVCKVCVSEAGSVLNLEGDNSFIKLDEDAEVNISIQNIDSILAEDMIIEYDNSKLKFLDMSAAEGVRLIKRVNNDGNIRIVCSNKNINSSVKSLLLSLKFKSSGTGVAYIRISSAKVSNGINKLISLDKSQLSEKILFIS